MKDFVYHTDKHMAVQDVSFHSLRVSYEGSKARQNYNLYYEHIYRGQSFIGIPGDGYFSNTDRKGALPVFVDVYTSRRPLWRSTFSC
jgi:hypothetical protein